MTLVSLHQPLQHLFHKILFLITLPTIENSVPKFKKP